MALWEEFNNIDVRDYQALHPELFAYVKEAMAGPGKQYLLIGDTAHSNDDIKKFKNSPTLAALFRYAAVPHVCLETDREGMSPARLGAYREKLDAVRNGLLPEEALEKAEAGFWKDLDLNWRRMAERYDKYNAVSRQIRKNTEMFASLVRRGRITPEKGARILQQLEDSYPDSTRRYLGARTLGFTHAGLRVTAADSWQWQDPPLRNLGERIFLGDREVANYIGAQAHGEKTAVIYGAAHFQYDGALGARLGRDQCVHIDIYAGRDEYLRQFSKGKSYTDFMPDRIYLLRERVLEKPNAALYRAAKYRTRDEAQDYKDGVARTFGPNARPARKEAAIARIKKLPEMDAGWFNYIP